jgi:hypothetical protein
MSKQKNNSKFNIGKTKWGFSKQDPPWFKIVIYLLTIFFYLALALIFKGGSVA